MTSPLNAYMQDLRHSILLTREEEQALCIRKDAGDLEARDQLILAVRPWAFHKARRYLSDLDTATSLADEAAMRAVEKFDYRRGRLTTVTSWWVFSVVNRYLTEDSTVIHVPNFVDEPNTRSHFKRAGKRARKVVSLQRPLESRSATSEQTPGDTIPDHRDPFQELEEYRERTAAIAYVHAAMRELPESRRTVLEMHMGGMEYLEIAKRLGVAKQRAHQLVVDAKRRLTYIMHRRPFSQVDSLAAPSPFQLAEAQESTVSNITPYAPERSSGTHLGAAESLGATDLTTLLDRLTPQEVQRAIEKVQREYAQATATYKQKLAQLHVLEKAVAAKGGKPSAAGRGSRPLLVTTRAGRKPNLLRIAEYLGTHEVASAEQISKALKIGTRGVIMAQLARKDVLEKTEDGQLRLTAAAQEFLNAQAS